VIEALGLTEALADKLVVGQNISQTYQFVDTANAELGFVALSQVIEREDGSRWVVDAELYEPITQDAVLLTDNEAAEAFLDFVRSSDTAREIIASYGYGFANE
jgi:molybdate transport system substrate-binding protein